MFGGVGRMTTRQRMPFRRYAYRTYSRPFRLIYKHRINPTNVPQVLTKFVPAAAKEAFEDNWQFFIGTEVPSSLARKVELYSEELGSEIYEIISRDQAEPSEGSIGMGGYDVGHIFVA